MPQRQRQGQQDEAGQAPRAARDLAPSGRLIRDRSGSSNEVGGHSAFRRIAALAANNAPKGATFPYRAGASRSCHERSSGGIHELELTSASQAGEPLASPGGPKSIQG